MDLVRIAKKWLEKELESKISRGRPRRQRIDQVKQEVEGREIKWHLVERKGIYIYKDGECSYATPG